jgi:hypothetical protein
MLALFFKLPASRLSAHMALQRLTKKKSVILISVQIKRSLQSSEFLLTKDREITDDVHQGPISVNLDDELFLG